MNNFVNIKKLEKIYFLQEFLKESLGDGKNFQVAKVQQNSLTASYPLKLLN